ncbi:MAG: sarcosine oxidase subunit delta [Candidatus Rariloculaceae bacterium]
MLKINCPFCGPRNESEFLNGGPARDKRPDDPDQVTNSGWVEFLTVTPNPLGPVSEEWWHVLGCSRWFRICRDTVTHEILEDTLKSHE